MNPPLTRAAFTALPGCVIGATASGPILPPPGTQASGRSHSGRREKASADLQGSAPCSPPMLNCPLDTRPAGGRGEQEAAAVVTGTPTRQMPSLPLLTSTARRQPGLAKCCASRYLWGVASIDQPACPGEGPPGQPPGFVRRHVAKPGQPVLLSASAFFVNLGSTWAQLGLNLGPPRLLKGSRTRVKDAAALRTPPCTRAWLAAPVCSPVVAPRAHCDRMQPCRFRPWAFQFCQ